VPRSDLALLWTFFYTTYPAPTPEVSQTPPDLERSHHWACAVRERGSHKGARASLHTRSCFGVEKLESSAHSPPLGVPPRASSARAVVACLTESA
jgi:hypothetical protein